MGARRKIIQIDEDKCNGCGLCVPSCAEGAIQLIDGKARLVSETYCDGLGACLGECPVGAITIEEREAVEFDEKAVKSHLKSLNYKSGAVEPAELFSAAAHSGGCPGSLSRTLELPEEAKESPEASVRAPSRLANWPVQLKLAPVMAPYFEGADILLSADCVPFASADFHRRFMAGRTVLVGCPKLDDNAFYREKLSAIFKQNEIRSVEVVVMEVPCCSGLAFLAGEALKDSGREIPVKITLVGIRGEVSESADKSYFIQKQAF